MVAGETGKYHMDGTCFRENALKSQACALREFCYSRAFPITPAYSMIGMNLPIAMLAHSWGPCS